MIWYKKKHDITMTVALNLPVENLKKSHHNKKEDHIIKSTNLILKSCARGWKWKTNYIRWLSYMRKLRNLRTLMEFTHVNGEKQSSKTNMGNRYFFC